MNKNGEKVNKAQLKENERCLRAYQAGNLNQPTYEACINADEKGRVQRAEKRTMDREVRKCDSLDEPPPFAYTNWETVNPAAVAGARELVYWIFGGPPVSDDDLVTRAENKQLARCQLEMLKRGDRLENIVLKEVNKAKKQAIKDASVTSDAALEAELENVFILNKRITGAQDRLVRHVDRKCSVLQTPPSTVFPGECGDVDTNSGLSHLRQVEVCVIGAARCEACLKINAFDGLDMDCEIADDGVDNGSCSNP
jgi:hypothetical protein